MVPLPDCTCPPTPVEGKSNAILGSYKICVHKVPFTQHCIECAGFGDKNTLTVLSSPTPDVGEEWMEEFEKKFIIEGTTVKDFISKCLSQREARVRGEAYRDGTRQGEFDARVRLEAELVESIRLKARQETIAECVEALKAKGEEAVKGLWYITEDQFEALQSLSPNQK